MLDALKFVRGAVADKDLMPVLTHFHVEDGLIQGFDGRLTMEAPVPELGGMTFTVPADRFIRAVDACGGEPTITQGEKVSIKKGSFRAFLASLAGFPRQTLPDPYGSPCHGLLGALAQARPFISEDASRLWSLGILIDTDGYAYATNNACLVRVPLGFEVSQAVNVPVYAVDELLRIGEEPEQVAFTEGAMYCFWSGGRRLKATTLSAAWPGVASMIVAAGDTPVPDGLFEACETLAKMVPNLKVPVLRLTEEGVTTEEGEHTAAFDLPAALVGRYDWRMLKLVLGVAEEWSALPDDRAAFRGAGIEGIFVGMRT